MKAVILTISAGGGHNTAAKAINECFTTLGIETVTIDAYKYFNKYLSDTEYIIFMRGKGARVYGEYKTKRKYFVTKSNTKDKRLYGHPTCKPVDIVKTLIFNSSQEGDVVLDPFIWSGTTAVSAIKEKRHFIGMELNKEYYDIACKRIKKEREEIETSLFNELT